MTSRRRLRPSACRCSCARAIGYFQSYFISGRGVQHTSNTFGLLDVTPWGRQESWEQSPAGFPQEPTYSWRRLRDRYDRPARG